MTLLEELGGREAVTAVVAAFYDRVLADERLRPYFRGTQMSRLQAHQIDFFCAALGGEPCYRGRDMKTAHAGLNISNADFDAVAGHLAAVLEGAGAPADAVRRVIDAIAPLRGDVVTRP
jgi:hemoglobin